MFELSYSFVLLLFWLHGGSSRSLFSSCSGRNVESWNTDMVPEQIESWINSGVTVAGEGIIQSRLFHQHSGVFQHHFYYQNDGREDDEKDEFKSIEEFEDPDKSDNEDGDFYDDQDINFADDKQEEETDLEDFEYQYFNENDRSVVTIGTFSNGIPTGLVWQWRSRRFEDGFLYGKVNKKGRFTGDDITFIYPDLKTGIRGSFINGYLVGGIEVKITAERCNGGLKELKIVTVKKRRGIVWRRENLNSTYIGKHTTVRDPLERRNTYIGQSSIPGSNEGVFAKRDFLPGQLVMYFSGLKLQERELFSAGMSEAEQVEAGAYYFGFSRTYHGFPGFLVIDQPTGYRTVQEYRTTLGHKINHNFIGTNTNWGFVRHPSHGPVVSIIANQPIVKGQELFINYNYDMKSAPQWYVAFAKQIRAAAGKI